MPICHLFLWLLCTDIRFLCGSKQEHRQYFLTSFELKKNWILTSSTGTIEMLTQMTKPPDKSLHWLLTGCVFVVHHISCNARIMASRELLQSPGASELKY